MLVKKQSPPLDGQAVLQDRLGAAVWEQASLVGHDVAWTAMHDIAQHLQGIKFASANELEYNIRDLQGSDFPIQMVGFKLKHI